MNVKDTPKEEIYNKILSVVQTTGQGVPYFVIDHFDSDAVNELIEENKIKKVRTHFSHLPDEITYCLTEGYCIEDEGKEQFSSYNFIREYLGLEHEMMPNINITTGQMLRCDEEAWRIWKNSDMLSKMNSREEFEETSKLTIERYYTWLMKNQQAINVMLKLEPMESSTRILSDSDKEWIKSRSWFKNKDDIRLIDIEINKGNDSDNESIDINNQIITLSKELFERTNDKTILDNIKENEQEIENSLYHIKLRKYILRELNSGKSLIDLL